jgi:hypothetical protein
LSRSFRQDGIVGADDFDEAAIARVTRIRDDDAVKGPLFGAGAGQTKFQGH